MLFNIKVPRSGSFVALLAALPVFLSYVLGIYWNNHHHLCRHPSLSRAEFSGPIFICFFGFRSPRSRRRGWDKTTWPLPPCRSRFNLLCAGIAYFILTRSLVAHHREDSQLAMSVGNDRKGRLSIAICTIAIPFAFVKTWAAYLCYVLVAVMWLLPDPRIEKAVHN